MQAQACRPSIVESKQTASPFLVLTVLPLSVLKLKAKPVGKNVESNLSPNHQSPQKEILREDYNGKHVLA